MDNQERMNQAAAGVADLFGAVPFALVVHPGPELPVMTTSSLPADLQLQLFRHLVESFEQNLAREFNAGHLDNVKPGFVTAGDMRAAALSLRVAAKRFEAGSATLAASPEFAASCGSVARWLEACADTLDGKTQDPNKCECGTTLANAAVRGVSTLLCPECDRDYLEELQHA